MHGTLDGRLNDVNHAAGTSGLPGMKATAAQPGIDRIRGLVETIGRFFYGEMPNLGLILRIADRLRFHCVWLFARLDGK